MNPVKTKIEACPLFDGAVLRHGFVDYMRDYEVLAAVLVGGQRQEERHRYHFVGCPEAQVTTTLRPDVFASSLPDEFVLSGPDYPDQDDPEGFIWGVRWANAYPGLSYVDDGSRAKHWSALLGVPMHQALLATNAYEIKIVFSEFRHEVIGPPRDDLERAKDYPIVESP